MKTTFYPSEERGHANHGWLKSKHSFSFASFFDPTKINFGALRVINQDWVAPNMGFGEHPHSNMEIISIPYNGELKHRDSEGNAGTIKKGEVQIMSAGTGITHSEMNASSTDPVEFLQIWITPKNYDVSPRYQQQYIETDLNQVQTLVGPENGSAPLWIHQDAYIHQLQTDEKIQDQIPLKGKDRKAYVFVLHGEVTIDGATLSDGDALGITETENISFEAESNTNVLFFDLNAD